MTQQFTITVSRPDGTPIPVVVTKKRVKNFNLRVTSSGEVHASAPLGASREHIEAFVKRNSAWIISRLAQREQRQTTAQESLSPSSIIALWGKPITVQDALDHNFDPPAPRPKQATFASFMGTDEPDERPQAKWNAPLDGLTPSEIQAHIDQLYTSEVTSALRDMVHAYEIAMGVAVSRVSVRSMKTRWGSCTPKTGAIRIARELAAYPVECLDMVVAHELVHLLEPSHNHRFHALLDTYCPNNRALSQRLKKPPANELYRRLAHALDLDTAACQGKTDGRPRLIELNVHAKQ